MNLRIIYIAIITVTISCKDSSNSRLTLRVKDGVIAEGNFINDTILNGVVKFFDSASQRYIGYSNYYYGQQIGPHIEIDFNGRFDSIFYQRPIKSGYEYMFDSNKNIVYKAFIYDDRVVGPVFNYDKSGKDPHVYFYNFEGKIIYESYTDETGRYEKGSPIYFTLSDKLINGLNQTSLFLYLIPQPDQSSYYELVVMNDKKQIVKSNKLLSSKFYIEILLESIQPMEHYALIYHYSSNQQKDKIVIQEIYLN